MWMPLCGPICKSQRHNMFADPPPDYQKKLELEWFTALNWSSFELYVGLIFSRQPANAAWTVSKFSNTQCWSFSWSSSAQYSFNLVWNTAKKSRVIRRQVSTKTSYSIHQSQSARNTLLMTILMKNCSTILSLCQKSKTWYSRTPGWGKGWSSFSATQACLGWPTLASLQ